MDEVKRAKVESLRAAIGQIRPDATKRRSFTASQREAVHERARGSCECCHDHLGDRWHIDHRIPIAQGGAHSPDNWQALCISCHKAKTKGDVKVIAKTKRIIKVETEGRKPSKLKSRGFSKKLRKRMDGAVEAR